MKKLYLSDIDRKLLGVCGGIARFLGVDSTVVRLSLVLITLLSAGFPTLLYIELTGDIDKSSIQAGTGLKNHLLNSNSLPPVAISGRY